MRRRQINVELFYETGRSVKNRKLRNIHSQQNREDQRAENTELVHVSVGEDNKMFTCRSRTVIVPKCH